MELHKNDVVTLTVDACTIDGSGIGRADGMAVFLPAAAVGDTVSAHILKVKKNYAFAKVAQVIAPSPAMVTCSVVEAAAVSRVAVAVGAGVGDGHARRTIRLQLSWTDGASDGGTIHRRGIGTQP